VTSFALLCDQFGHVAVDQAPIVVDDKMFGDVIITWQYCILPVFTPCKAVINILRILIILSRIIFVQQQRHLLIYALFTHTIQEHHSSSYRWDLF